MPTVHDIAFVFIEYSGQELKNNLRRGFSGGVIDFILLVLEDFAMAIYLPPYRALSSPTGCSLPFATCSAPRFSFFSDCESIRQLCRQCCYLQCLFWDRSWRALFPDVAHKQAECRPIQLIFVREIPPPAALRPAPGASVPGLAIAARLARCAISDSSAIACVSNRCAP